MLQPVASDEEIAQQLVWWEHQISLLQLEASMLTAELDRSGFLEEAGYNSPTDWLRFNCHLTDKAAGERIRVGEHLAELPMSVVYLRDGEIGYSHLTVMARTAEAVGKVFDERKLLGLALEHTPGKFYYKSLRRCHQPSPMPEHGRGRAPADQWRARSHRWRGGAERTRAPGPEVGRPR